MVKIVFRTACGGQHAVEANEGDTLMTAAVFAGVPGIEGLCGGAMACGTCHLRIGEPWSSQLPAPGAAERELLDALEGGDAASRLGCQIVATTALEGMVVTVANA